MCPNKHKQDKKYLGQFFFRNTIARTLKIVYPMTELRRIEIKSKICCYVGHNRA